MHEVSHRSCEVGRHRKFSNKVWCIGPSRNSVILLVKPSLFVDVLALPSSSRVLKLPISSSSSSSSPNGICPLIPLKTKRITCERKRNVKRQNFFLFKSYFELLSNNFNLTVSKDSFYVFFQVFDVDWRSISQTLAMTAPSIAIIFDWGGGFSIELYNSNLIKETKQTY